MSPVAEFLLALFAAHFLGDYVFQSDRMAAEKGRGPVLAAHAAIHGGLAYLCAGQLSAWWLIPLIAGSHALIDAWKLRVRGARAGTLLLDQLAHGAVIALLTCFAAGSLSTSLWAQLFDKRVSQLWLLIIGSVLCVRVAGILIGYWVQPYLREIDAAKGAVAASPTARGLTNGGRVIGQWERALIFLFVLVNQPAAIGFLIAAKSIFRFGELKDRENRMEAEYITIGTLMSFGWATAVAYLTVWCLQNI